MLIAVRKKNTEFDEMCDLKTLKQWARSGILDGDDLVREDGQWKPAKNALMLKGIFASAAWDVAEDELWTPSLSAPKTKSGDTKLGETHPIPPIQSFKPVEQDSARGDEYERSTSTSPVKKRDIDFEEVEREYHRSKPQLATESASTSQNFTKSETLKTPTVSIENSKLSVHNSSDGTVKSTLKEGTLNNASVRWNPEVDLKDQLGLLVDEMPTKSNFSWFRLMILVVPGAFILFMIRAFVISEAQTVFPDGTTPDSDTVSVDSNVGNAPIPTNTQSDTLYALEADLKSKLRNNTQAVTPEQSLADALRVDLEYVGLEIVRIDARVLSWKGRMLDQPKSASVSVVIESMGEVETEFILASLVIAKYSVRYYLEMPRFTVSIQDGDFNLSKSISTEKAQFLYLQPGSLKDFIQALSETP